MYFSAAASSENDQGSMNLASNTASVPSTIPSRVAAIQGMAECLTRRWTSRDPPAGIALVPGAVEVLGRGPELHDEVAGQVLRLGLAPFLAPEADQGGFVAAHDDPGVGAADEGAAIELVADVRARRHYDLPRGIRFIGPNCCQRWGFEQHCRQMSYFGFIRDELKWINGIL